MTAPKPARKRAAEPISRCGWRTEQHWPHWCRDGHEPIGFRWDEERCPLCKDRDERRSRLQAEREKALVAWEANPHGDGEQRRWGRVEGIDRALRALEVDGE